MTEAEERTGGVGWQERSRSLYTGECLADSAIGKPHSRERQLAHERKGRTAVLTHRERLLEHAFCRDEIAPLERDSPPSANRVDHRRMRGQAYRFGTRERPFREMLGLGQQAFDAGNPGEGAGQSDLLQTWCGEWVQGAFAYFACAAEIAEPQSGARDEDGSVLSDLVVGKVLRSGIVGQRSFDLVGFSVLHPNESPREHESSAVDIVELAGAVARTDDPRRRLVGGGTRGQRERKVDEATGFTWCTVGSYLGGKAVQHATVASDVGVDEAASEQLECFRFLTRHQEVTERTLDVARVDEILGGASMQGLLALRILRVESVPQQITEQMVVPVGITGQLDQEQVPVVDAAQQRAGVTSLGHRRATLCVELFEDRSRKQEVEDLSGLAFEHLRSEEVGDRARRLREL